MEIMDPLRWRKSSTCDSGTCVEAAEVGDTVVVRDSKNPGGPILQFTKDEWNAFIVGVQYGEFEFR